MGQYDVDEIEFYRNGWLDNIDMASVTNDELKDLTYYQVEQATGTYNEMVSMEESDPDYDFGTMIITTKRITIYSWLPN